MCCVSAMFTSQKRCRWLQDSVSNTRETAKLPPRKRPMASHTGRVVTNPSRRRKGIRMMAKLLFFLALALANSIFFLPNRRVDRLISAAPPSETTATGRKNGKMWKLKVRNRTVQLAREHRTLQPKPQRLDRCFPIFSTSSCKTGFHPISDSSSGCYELRLQRVIEPLRFSSEGSWSGFYSTGPQEAQSNTQRSIWFHVHPHQQVLQQKSWQQRYLDKFYSLDYAQGLVPVPLLSPRHCYSTFLFVRTLRMGVYLMVWQGSEFSKRELR